MALLQDLIQQIDEPALRARILQETNKLLKQKKFGLVFEEHIPECTPLYDIPVRKGGLAALKDKNIQQSYVVEAISGDTAKCFDKENKATVEIPVSSLVSIVQFGDPIYPCLKPIDKAEKAPDSDLWHTLIEAENYHALQLLEYLYAGKVDCIYIDPPYNTGARDWKYNNDYVDSSDTYRHSKWLSMMEKRLKIAKKLLNPIDSVLIVTIDEKEYLHLGCLLEKLFPDARMQMISSIINPKGVSSQSGFRRADEYIYFVMVGKASPCSLPLGNEWSPSALKSVTQESIPNKPEEPGWTSMMRRGSHSSRSERPGLYYAIYADPEKHMISKVGEILPISTSRDFEIEGLVQILPIRTNGSEGCWQVGPTELKSRIKQGRIRLGKETSYGYVVNYLPDGEYTKILNGEFTEEGRADDGSIRAYAGDSGQGKKWIAPTQWKIATHDASAYGSTLLQNILTSKRFSFPKSLYAVRDTLRFFVNDKPNAIILDFFAGSGTTLHAINLMNAEDGGERQCVIVTNNEVSDDDSKKLIRRGIHPGDDEWEKLGIARFVTWPRTVCSINGQDINGKTLRGNYIGSDFPISNGFKANCEYFKLTFLDKTSIALGRQFRELLPMLWMKSGAIGKCPVLGSNKLPEMLILPKNRLAILIDEIYYSEFDAELKRHSEIQTVFIVTDSEVAYRTMISTFDRKTCYQLYRDYLDNFRINTGR